MAEVASCTAQHIRAIVQNATLMKAHADRRSAPLCYRSHRGARGVLLERALQVRIVEYLTDYEVKRYEVKRRETFELRLGDETAMAPTTD